MVIKPFKVIAGGNPATAIRHDKIKPRAMRVREMKKGIKKGCLIRHIKGMAVVEAAPPKRNDIVSIKN